MTLYMCLGQNLPLNLKTDHLSLAVDLYWAFHNPVGLSRAY